MDEKLGLVRSTLAFFDHQGLRASHTQALKIKELFIFIGFIKTSFSFVLNGLYERVKKSVKNFV